MSQVGGRSEGRGFGSPISLLCLIRLTRELRPRKVRSRGLYQLRLSRPSRPSINCADGRIDLDVQSGADNYAGFPFSKGRRRSASFSLAASDPRGPCHRGVARLIRSGPRFRRRRPRHRHRISPGPAAASSAGIAAGPGRGAARGPAAPGRAAILRRERDPGELAACAAGAAPAGAGPRSVDAFVESLRGNDATFDVLVNQARILNLKQDITTGPTQALIAVGDPTILDFTVVNPRQIRIIGRGIGVTDLAITTARNETYTFEIRVLADLTMIKGKLRATFPDASIRLSQIRDHFVVEGEARDPAQIARIIQTITAYLASVYIEQGRTVTVGQTRQVLGALGGQAAGAGGSGRRRGCAGSCSPGLVLPDATRRAGCAAGIVPGAEFSPAPDRPGAAVNPLAAYAASAELGGPTQSSNRGAPPQIINLLRVAGSQQVMLKVRIAELNRTAMRQHRCQLPGRRSPHRRHRRLGHRRGDQSFQGTIGQPGNMLTRQLNSTDGRRLAGPRTGRGTRPSSASSRTPTSSSRSPPCGRTACSRSSPSPTWWP